MALRARAERNKAAGEAKAAAGRNSCR